MICVLPHSLDFLRDIPQYLVADIIHHLQSESSSTLCPSPHPQAHHSPSCTPHSAAARPISCHVPSSLICNLSSGQIYRNIQPVNVPTAITRPHTPPCPLPPANGATTAHSMAPCAKKRKRRATQPSVPEKTSFSRALSHCPLAVLNKTGSNLQKNGSQAPSLPRAAVCTINHKLDLPPSSHQTHPHSSLSHQTHPHSSLSHNTRYPLGNPVVPRTPQAPCVDPFLAPYPPLSLLPPATTSHFLHVTSADIHNSRLVTLHCSGRPAVSNQAAITQEHPNQTENEKEVIQLPAISPSPPPLPSISPDHMQLGAQIVGNQLVLERSGEHIVHPLREPSQTSVSRASCRPDTSSTGTHAPPPTAS